MASGTDCSRISGLSLEPQRLRAKMEVARGEPIAANDLNRVTVVIGFPSRRSGPVRHLFVLLEAAMLGNLLALGSRGCSQAAGAACSVNSRLRRQTAQTMRASLLARAMVALL